MIPNSTLMIFYNLLSDLYSKLYQLLNLVRTKPLPYYILWRLPEPLMLLFMPFVVVMLLSDSPDGASDKVHCAKFGTFEKFFDGREPVVTVMLHIPLR